MGPTPQGGIISWNVMGEAVGTAPVVGLSTDRKGT